MEASAMAGLRVLELADQRGSLCGRLLADMGADVIKVEPPGGDPARRIGPFLDDRPHPDRSLFFWFYNLNKRAMVLDYNSSAGAELLLRLQISRLDVDGSLQFEVCRLARFLLKISLRKLEVCPREIRIGLDRVAVVNDCFAILTGVEAGISLGEFCLRVWGATRQD